MDPYGNERIPEIDGTDIVTPLGNVAAIPTAPDGNYIVGMPWMSPGVVGKPQAVMWITDELLDRASYHPQFDANGNVMGDTAGYNRLGLDWCELKKLESGVGVARRIDWLVILTGRATKRSWTYMLENVRDEMRNITRMRWPD